MLVRDFIFWLSTKKAVTDAIARRGMRYGFARRFIAGETLEEALAASAELGRAGRRVSLNHLGENVGASEEAERARDSYIRMVRELDTKGLDGNVSIKLTQLGLDFDRSLCQKLTADIAAAAQSLGRTIEVDMEGTAYTDATLDIFEATRRRFANIGLAIQAYLYRSEKDLERLAPLEPKVRLVKGAYREPPNLAYQKKSDVDANYRRLLDRLLAPSANGRFFPAIATHDPRMLDYARQQLNRHGWMPERYEFQMIYGVRRDLQQGLREQCHPLRIYVPFGTEWCPYFMRRLAERPANCWFVLRNLAAESFRKDQRGG
jgi:proline dehydrogenase